jgi:HK97 family phage major capsid protein
MAVSIAELKRAKAGFIKEMGEIARKDAADEGDASRFDELENCVKDHDSRIEKIEGVMQLESDNAEPADNEEMAFDAPVVKVAPISRKVAVGFSKRPANEIKGTRFARFVIGAGLAYKHGGNAGLRYIQDNFGDTEVAKALNTTTQATGGALIPQDYRQELISLLYAETVVRGSGAREIPMPTGNLTWPRLNAGATAQWDTELDDIAISVQGFDDLQFVAKKLTALVPVSNKLIRESPISVEAIVRDNSAKMMARAEDLAFLLSDGTSNRPTGLTSLAAAGNILHAVASAFTTVTLAGVNGLLMSLELALKANNVPVGNAVWIFHPVVRSFLNTLTDSTGRYFFRDELNAGKLLGYSVKETTQLPTNLASTTDVTQILFVAMDQVVIADTLQMFADSSSEAAYNDGSTVISAYQRNQTLFRTISEVDFGVMHPAAIAWSAVKAWTPGSFTYNAGAPYITQTAVTTPSSAGSANPV